MSDSKFNKVHIYLKFYDFDIHPHEISEILNLKPAKLGLKGDIYSIGSIEKIKKTYKTNWWEFRKDFETGEKWVQEPVNEFIIEVIEPRKKEIREVMSKGDGEFSVVPYFYSEANPGFFFESETIKILSEASLPFNLDIYCL